MSVHPRALELAHPAAELGVEDEAARDLDDLAVVHRPVHRAQRAIGLLQAVDDFLRAERV
eukprot:CAMPEP_0182798552 /NCGR_PEP_ID=MMETSP0006_2-20121128/1409_1 /TAXON_ID=97485 /ORGANISM="Prymnesium parvum, Strain Texoma1" /LENGTH=59 /DNA_ID=CAMNT_0024923673 /DNA_START=476 /DNA_END=652 /DNA_ORIENTATION=+